ncbi:zinc-dependent alcohol dehydrogenase family protein [Streptomyces lushanensis]|uniref:zinc-dependent alcohol dehydrogenase family protein n=1 Tax=Streptomyces lushanensis TaxID=1434255 RepID=UPI00083526F0|nr:zinc-dependent alcohol dehydrogenase family protein [Streptomyces lushanensis]
MSRIILKEIGPVSESVQLEPHPDLTLGPADVLVEMEAAGINLTDFRLAEGTYTERVRPSLPSAMGTEGVGRVIAAGTTADPSLVGRRVVFLPNYLQGTWADRTVAPASSVIPVGEKADAQQLALLAVNPATAYGLLNRYATLGPGDWIGQDMGNSAVGRNVIALAHHAGVRTLSVVRREETVKQLLDQGADLVVVGGAGKDDVDGLRDRIADALGDTTFRLVFDGVGGPVAGALAHSLEFGGQVISYSSLTHTPVAVPAADLVYRELGVRGYWLINWIRTAPRAEIEAVYTELAELVEQGVLHTPVEETFALADYRAAFDRARKPQREGKILFHFGA